MCLFADGVISSSIQLDIYSQLFTKHYLYLWVWEKDVEQIGLYWSKMKWPNGDSENVIIGIGMDTFKAADQSRNGACLSDKVTALFTERIEIGNRDTEYGKLLKFHVENLETIIAKSELRVKLEMNGIRKAVIVSIVVIGIFIICLLAACIVKACC